MDEARARNQWEHTSALAASWSGKDINPFNRRNRMNGAGFDRLGAAIEAAAK